MAVGSFALPLILSLLPPSLACRCNGETNSAGQGECRSRYQGEAWCYVHPGHCYDQRRGEDSGRLWSYLACKPAHLEASCECNGVVKRRKGERARGECKTKTGGKSWCYVEEGACQDATYSSASEQFWSHRACQLSLSSTRKVSGRRFFLDTVC